MVQRLAEIFRPPEGLELNPARAVLDRLRGDVELARAAIEIARGQAGLPAGGLDSISQGAGRLLFDAGVVGSVDEGIVLFHREITKDKPSLRKILRKTDIKAGRIRPPRRSPRQRIIADAMKAGQVRRVNGRIVAFDPIVRRALRKAEQAEVRDKAERRKKRLRRLGVRR